MKYVSGSFSPTNPNKWMICVESLGNKQIKYRSSYELKLYEYFDVSKYIKFISIEPFAIPYIGVDKRKHRYFPDAVVKLINDKNLLIEVKPYCKVFLDTKSEQLRKKELFEFIKNKLKWEAARNVCKGKNLEFIIMTEKEIFSDLDAFFKKYSE